MDFKGLQQYQPRPDISIQRYCEQLGRLKPTQFTHSKLTCVSLDNRQQYVDGPLGRSWIYLYGKLCLIHDITQISFEVYKIIYHTNNVRIIQEEFYHSNQPTFYRHDIENLVIRWENGMKFGSLRCLSWIYFLGIIGYAMNQADMVQLEWATYFHWYPRIP